MQGLSGRLGQAGAARPCTSFIAQQRPQGGLRVTLPAAPRQSHVVRARGGRKGDGGNFWDKLTGDEVRDADDTALCSWPTAVHQP